MRRRQEGRLSSKALRVMLSVVLCAGMMPSMAFAEDEEVASAENSSGNAAPLESSAEDGGIESTYLSGWFDEGGYLYRGKFINPRTMYITRDGASEPVDLSSYEITYESTGFDDTAALDSEGMPDAAGEYYVTLTSGESDSYNGAVIQTQVVDLANLQNWFVGADCDYSVNPCKVSLSVHRSVLESNEAVESTEIYLTEGQDYRIKGFFKQGESGESLVSKDQITNGDWCVIVEAIEGSGFKGESTACFSIDSTSLTNATVLFNWDEETQMGDEWPASRFTLGNAIDLNERLVMPDGTVLRRGIDYEAIYFGTDEEWEELNSVPADEGQYAVVFRAKEGSAYSGERGQWCFEIIDSSNLAHARIYFDDFAYFDYDSGMPCFLYSGYPISPKVVVACGEGDGERILVEGVDYAIRYENNQACSTDESAAIVEITAIEGGSYRGVKTETFNIVKTLDLSRWLDSRGYELRARNALGYRTAEGGAVFLNEGATVKPYIWVYDEAGVSSEGRDYTVAFQDAQGNSISAPAGSGDYQLVVTPTSEGIFAGSDPVAIPLFLQDSVELSQLRAHAWDWYVEHENGEDSTRVYVVNRGDRPSFDLHVSSVDGDAPRLIEGVDFEMEFDESAPDGVYTATIKGMGRFVGEMSLAYCYKALPFEKLLNWRIDGEEYEDDGDGLQVPTLLFDPSLPMGVPYVHCEELALGADYVCEGFMNEAGQKIAAIEQPGRYYLDIAGRGDYEGLSMALPVDLVNRSSENPGGGDASGGDDGPEKSTFDLATDLHLNVQANRYKDAEGQGGPYVWLKKNEDTPQLDAYAVENDHSRIGLEEGKHYTKTVARSGSKMTVTFSAVPGSICTGSYSLDFDLVDSYDIGKLWRFWCYAVSNAFIEGQSEGFDVSVGMTDSVTEKDLEERVDYSISFLDSQGQSVDRPKVTGAYTMHVQGLGDYSGEVEETFHVQVYSADEKINLRECRVDNVWEIELGEDPNKVLNPKVTLGSNIVLAPGVDYDISYRDYDSEGRAWAIVTGKGDRFGGTIAEPFRVVDPKNISNAELELYNGQDWISVGTWAWSQQELAELPINADTKVRIGKYKHDGEEPPVGSYDEEEWWYEHHVFECVDPSNYTVSMGNNEAVGNIGWVKVSAVEGSGYTGALRGNYRVIAEGSSGEEDVIFASGSCGENVRWELDKFGVLRITGKGVMPDYTSDPNHATEALPLAPWYDYRDKIRYAIIGDGATRGVLSPAPLRAMAFVENDIEGITGIGKNAFAECTNLETVSIGDTVTSIGAGAFANCAALEEVSIPDQVTEIASGAFENCTSLVAVSLPTALSAIKESAFAGCASLGAVELPSSLSSIGVSAFAGCASLNEVVVPDAVTDVGDNAFSNCSALQTVIVGNPEATIGQGALAGIASNAVVFVSSDQASKLEEQGGAPSDIRTEIPKSGIEGAEIIVDTSSCIYDGAAKKPPLTVKIDGEKLVQGVDYDVVWKNNVDAGDARVDITGKGSYWGSKSTSFVIKSATVSSLGLSVTSFIYNAAQQKPMLTVKSGNKILSSSDYTVSWPSGMTNAGTYTVSVSGKGNYSGTQKASFIIRSATPVIKLSQSSFTFNGKTQKPGVTVVLNGEVLPASLYTISYTASKQVGSHSVTVSSPNFSKSIVASYKIVAPVVKTTKMMNVKAARKCMAIASWKKASGKVSGYQVQWSTNKKFKSGNKTKTVSGAKKTSLKITKLKVKKKYYVRVRTMYKVGGKTFYSKWSSAKSVKAKK